MTCFSPLLQELGTTFPDPQENLSLLELERYLRHSVEKLQEEVKKRRLRIRDLRQEEQVSHVFYEGFLSNFTRNRWPSVYPPSPLS